MRRIEYIVIHHTLTKDGKVVNWEAIRNYHKNERGWKDIGYHFGIEKIGKHYEILVGRGLDMPGAHAIGVNQNSIGIAIVGNFDQEIPDRILLEKTISFVRSLAHFFSIPAERIIGHREVHILAEVGLISEHYRTSGRKSCPGWNLSMNVVRAHLVDLGIPIRDDGLFARLYQFDKQAMQRKEIFW